MEAGIILKIPDIWQQATNEWVDEGRYYVDAYGRWVA